MSASRRSGSGGPRGGRRREKQARGRPPGRQQPPRLLLASGEGEFFEHPTLEVPPALDTERLPLELGGPELFRVSPSGTRLMPLVGCRPVGWDPVHQRRVRVEAVERNARSLEVWAAGASLPPDWLCLRAPSTEPPPGAPAHPQPGYCEVGGCEGEVLVAASNLYPASRPDAPTFDTPDLPSRVQRRLAGSPGNRVLRRLAHCALEYSCRLAQNFFYKRGTTFLPVSGACDIECRGCASLGTSHESAAAQGRQHGTARVEDLLGVAGDHLREVPDGAVTFGMGAGGDPRLALERIERTILVLRTRTSAGWLNVDTQAGLPSSVGRLFTAGLTSVLVGLNSALRERYEDRYRCVGATFDNLRGCLGVARGKGGRIFLGLEVLPGFSDQPSELEALVGLISEFRVDGVQLRSLVGDPQGLCGISLAEEAALGIGEFLRQLRTRVPGLWLGTADLPAPAVTAAAGSPTQPGGFRHPARSR